MVRYVSRITIALLVVMALSWSARAADLAIHGSMDLSYANPMIAVGDPAGAPPVVPGDRIDPNVTSSPFSGVMSINPANDGGSFLCTGVLIADNIVLTAAHCVDHTGGVGATGDGVVDFLPSEIALVFNENNPTNNSAGATIIRGVSSIHVHPDWHGFNNSGGPEGASIHDDIAVLVLNDAAPAGIPRYALNADPFLFIETITMAGYGYTGDAISGYDTGTANYFIKRTGQNDASTYLLDEEAPNTDREVFMYDFDGPDLTTDTLGDGPTLGNEFETIIGPGDSGGPSFLWDDTGDGIVQAEELTLFGINTFTYGGGAIPTAPHFGSRGGGMVVSTYADFINSVPEPTSMLLLIAGGLVLGRKAWRIA